MGPGCEVVSFEEGFEGSEDYREGGFRGCLEVDEEGDGLGWECFEDADGGFWVFDVCWRGEIGASIHLVEDGEQGLKVEGVQRPSRLERFAGMADV